MTESVKLVYSVKEAAVILNCSAVSVYEGIRRNQIPSIHVGKKRVVVPVAALNKLLESGQSIPPTQAWVIRGYFMATAEVNRVIQLMVKYSAEPQDKRQKATAQSQLC